MSTRPAIFRNPILRGSYPDPSICRVGDDFYLVNSSFEYFPGLPLHHSRDLVNWELIGYGLHRPAQCAGANNLTDVQTRGGIHAPTLRWHEGTFYIITTNVYVPPGANQPTQFVNFIITAADVRGPWSDPQIIAGAPGIDPDLFFDADGRAWYCGTHTPAQPNFPGEGEIWLQQLDLHTFSLIGDRHFLWRGACGGVWVEGPHLYRRDDRYYLLVAEGGTSFNHAVMVAVSDTVTGPYYSNPRNPILTTRHLSYDNWVHSVGHADLVELADGRWYMVALGIRGEIARASNMGRETFLLPVVWEREPFPWQEIQYAWPVCAPQTGRVERQYPLPLSGSGHQPPTAFHDDFQSAALRPDWNFRRLPAAGSYSLTARPGYLRLYARPAVFAERAHPPFLGVRQAESNFTFSAALEFTPDGAGMEAGLSLLQQDDNYLIFSLFYQDNRPWLRLTIARPGATATVPWQRLLSAYAGRITLRIAAGDDRYTLSYALDGEEKLLPCGEIGADLLLSRGYTGAYLGLYASSNGRPTSAYADFNWVRAEWHRRAG